MTQQTALRTRANLGNLAYGFVLAALLLSSAAFRSWLAATIGAAVAWALVVLVTGRRLRTAVGGLAATVTVVLLKLDPSALPLRSRLIGVSASMICALPLVTRSKNNGFPFVGVFCAVQGLYIYVGALIGRPSLPYRSTYTNHIRELGLVGSLGYVVLVVAVGMATRRRTIGSLTLRRWTSQVSSVSTHSDAYFRALIVFFVGLVAVRLLPSSASSHFGAIPQLVGLGRVVGFALILLLALRREISAPKKLIAISLVVLDVLLGVGFGGELLLYNGAAVALGALILALAFRRRVALWGVLLVLPVVIVLNAAKIQTRATATPIRAPISATSTLIRNTQAVITNRAPGVLTSAANRFANSDILGYVEFHVPKDYPYWNKRAYTELPSAVVPRVLDPWKPKIALANEFGRHFGLLAPDDFGTSANTSLQVEAWVNFGIPGLIGVGVIMGLLLGAAESIVDSSTLDGAAIGTVVALQFIGGIESGATALILIIPIVAVFTPVLHWVLGSSNATNGHVRPSPSAHEPPAVGRTRKRLDDNQTTVDLG